MNSEIIEEDEPNSLPKWHNRAFVGDYGSAVNAPSSFNVSDLDTISKPSIIVTPPHITVSDLIVDERLAEVYYSFYFDRSELYYIYEDLNLIIIESMDCI